MTTPRKSSSAKRAGKPLIASTGLRQFMFLASHGLRNPLTAIRWSCGRLQKVEKHTPEAEMYIEKIASNTDQLTRILGAIFLLSRLQDQLQPMKIEKLSLVDALYDAVPSGEDHSSISIQSDTDISIDADREVLHYLLTSILMACFVAHNGDASRVVDVHVQLQTDMILVTFTAQALLQFLRSNPPAKFNSLEEADQLIGGTTGLLLTLSRDLSIAMGGYLKLDEEGSSFTVKLSLPRE